MVWVTSRKGAQNEAQVIGNESNNKCSGKREADSGGTTRYETSDIRNNAYEALQLSIRDVPCLSPRGPIEDDGGPRDQ